jgi:hypothetical protein
MPIAVFFAGRGHAVYRVSSARAADLRKFLHRHAKSNGIDADTLARMPIADPQGLQQLELPGPDAAALDRRVRACDRLTRAASEHKVRIKDLVRQLMPMTPLTGDLGKADLAVLERWADPRALLAVSAAELTRLITTVPDKQQGPEREQQWRDAAAAAIALYGDDLAVPYAELAAEVTTEVRLLRAIQDELALHAAAREERYRRVDPGQRDRRHRPQGPADEQGRPVAAARHAVPRRRHRPPPGPPARPDLLPADDRARRQSPQGILRRRRPPRRTGPGHAEPRHPVRDLRQRREPGHRAAGPADHRGEVDRLRGDPQAAPQPQDGGEGPSDGRNRAAPARRPSPTPIVATPGQDRQPRHLTSPPVTTGPPATPPTGQQACPNSHANGG